MASQGEARNGTHPAKPSNNHDTAPGADDANPPPIGPHPGVVTVPVQFVFEQNIRQMQKAVGSDSAREDNYRLLGVQLIDNVRQALRLPVRTFDTAAIYYHRFRLRHREVEYNYQDSAMASLFLACKVEDTIKKSKDILCAAYNLKNPDHQTTPDDKIFEQSSRVIVGLERLILEIVGFDFRTRYPQKYLAKVVRDLIGPDQRQQGREFLEVAYAMSIDMYKTFVPIKQTCLAMVLAIVKLTTLVTGTHTEAVLNADPARWRVTKSAVTETVLDLLDLYTQFHKSTKLGARYDMARFIDIKIQINAELEGDAGLSRHEYSCEACVERDEMEGLNRANAGAGGMQYSITSPFNPIKPGSRSSDSTLRFVFDRELAEEEARSVEKYFKEEFEEYEIEVEEPLPEPERFPDSHHRDRQGPGHGPGHGGRGRGRGGRGGGGGRYDGGWGPYPRNPRSQYQGHPNDRRGGGGGGGGGGRRHH